LDSILETQSDHSAGGAESPVGFQRHYWPGVVLSMSPDHKLTPIQMQKSLFLIGENLRALTGPSFYAFEPHNYGPFSAEIYRDIDELHDEGFVAVRRVSGREWNEYESTPSGREVASTIMNRLPAAAQVYIGNVVNWTRRTPFNELLGAIYRVYPQYAVRSVFKALE
jgi:uncharacterized protein YwgA